MKNVLNKVFATIFIFLLSSVITYGYSDEWIEKVVVDKEFEINKNANLLIDHEFGNVRMENWDKDVISIVVTIRVETSSDEKAAEIINNVIVDVKGDRKKVEAVCELNQKYRNKKNVKVMIDFDIKMPKSISLDLDHSFGSVNIETVSGPTSISSEYGNIEIVSLDNAQNQIELSFGNGDIKYITNGEIEVGYSKISIDGADELSLEAEYSDVRIGKIKSLSFEIDGGNAEIEYVENLDVESSMTNIEIGELSGSLNCESDYGSVTIDYISKEFSNIAIANSFGAVNMNIDKNASYKFEADGHYCKVNYEEDNANISYRNSSATSNVIKGVLGKDSNPNSSVIISSEYGAVNIGSK